jgi:hypothetical protein
MATPPKPKPKVPTASKSPNKVTKNETAYAKQYRKVANLARTKVDIKGGMSREQAKAIRDARAQLQKMKAQAVKQGYGKLDTTKNKAGGYSSHNIYKGLTGKPLPPKKKPTK